MSKLKVYKIANKPVLSSVQRITKRGLDLLIATISLFLFAPVIIVLVVLIKFEDGGPILYRSERIGQYGKLFTMLKFRSMIVNTSQHESRLSQAERTSVAFCKFPNNPRVTKIGRLMRATGLDELPQLIHVLWGEMSLVGPRPELPWLLSFYEPWQYQRFGVPQGMTGWWQINGRRESPMQYLHIEQDIYYTNHYSFKLDLLILWRTIGVVLRGEGI